MRAITHCLFTSLFIFFFLCSAQAAPVVVSDITVTDVTPSSFSVLWNGDQAALPDLRVFSDVNGTQDITNQLTITVCPFKGQHSSVREQAREKGVMLIQASGLEPATTYYFQTVTIAGLTGEVTMHPAAPQFPSVITEDNSVRTNVPVSDEHLFTNDTLLINTPLENGDNAAEGTIISIHVAESSYPVTGIVGDGVPIPFAAIDGANIYDSIQHTNMPLEGGERVSVTRFLGTDGTETFDCYLLPPRQLAQQRGPIGLHEIMRVLQITSSQPDTALDLDYDINGDGMIGMEESLYFLQLMAGLR